MLMVRFLLSDSTEGCSAMQVYCPSLSLLTFFSVSLDKGKIQSSPWEKDRDIQETIGQFCLKQEFMSETRVSDIKKAKEREKERWQRVLF